METIELRNLFIGLQEQMLSSLKVNRGFISHAGSMGDATEQHWIEFLRTYLPDRYKVDKAIVIDAEGTVSKQIDVVIYDGMYTPFIFNQDGFKYIPAESVYAVFEVKQDINGNIEYAAERIESVRKLKRTSIEMVASGSVMKARLLTKIIGGVLTTSNSYNDEKTVKEHLSSLKGYQTIDLGCCCESGSFYVDYTELKPEKTVFSDLEIEDNRDCIEGIYLSRRVKDISFSDKDVSLFTFFLQLVSCLKSVGTVPAIDVNAYLKAIGEQIR
jgi:hypothetical protein